MNILYTQVHEHFVNEVILNKVRSNCHSLTYILAQDTVRIPQKSTKLSFNA